MLVEQSIGYNEELDAAPAWPGYERVNRSRQVP